jgi:hypothetical protein
MTTPTARNAEPLTAARLPGESPCSFVHGWDGWTNCVTHGWSGSRDQRSRVLVCPEAANAANSTPDGASGTLDGARPEIVVLCGSTRFYDEFQAANYDLTMLGKIVLSVGFYPHALTKHGHGEGVGHDSSEKIALDELHKRKIDLADRVYVLNVNGYIGESTRSEIEYAERHGKPVDYLESPERRPRPAAGPTRARWRSR